jgi:beta-glucanase (GH16 family)
VHLTLGSLPRHLVALLILPIAFTAACGESDAPPVWNLVWADEFEGPAGQLPDPARWGFDVGTGWGNQQLEWDTDRPENASLDGNGNLAITAREELFMGQPYTSARITTAGKLEQAYGKFEARIRLPVGQGYWPAFWLLGADIETVGWPGTGEIDVMEYRGQEPNVLLGSVHGPGYSGGESITSRYELLDGRFDTGFHVFGIEWEPDEIRWYVDGQVYHRVTQATVRKRGEWVFDHPFYIILNVAIGGTFVGPPNADTRFPQSMLVDWVRVYEAG